MAAERYDIAVIGAGVIGCAIARAFTLDGAKVVVLEKAADVLDGASKGNSAILHTGFDAPEGSLEQRCVAAGHAEYLSIREGLGLPLDPCGALVLAWSEEEEARLPALLAQAHANGVTDAAPLTAAEIRREEPHLSPRLRAGFRVPGESLIDPWSAPHAYLLQALLNGATLLRNAEVTGGQHDGTDWHLDTGAGPLRAGLVINAAGLWGDLLDERLLGQRDFTIRPRKGQFVVYDKSAASLAHHILLPVPTEKTKGIVLCRTAFGNLLVGPTAEDQDDRVTAALVPEALAALKARGEEILPALRDHEVTTLYAGLRPATQYKEYRIKAHPDRALITVGGIRSTGLSSALGTAQHVRALAETLGHRAAPLADPVTPRLPNISTTAPRDCHAPGHDGLICPCEEVTRREVEAALTGPLAPNTLAGLKRRTRVTMGRCQGFYCSAALATLTQGRLAQPMTGPADRMED